MSIRHRRWLFYFVFIFPLFESYQEIQCGPCPSTSIYQVGTFNASRYNKNSWRQRPGVSANSQFHFQCRTINRISLASAFLYNRRLFDYNLDFTVGGLTFFDPWRQDLFQGVTNNHQKSPQLLTRWPSSSYTSPKGISRFTIVRRIIGDPSPFLTR